MTELEIQVMNERIVYLETMVTQLLTSVEAEEIERLKLQTELSELEQVLTNKGGVEIRVALTKWMEHRRTRRTVS